MTKRTFNQARGRIGELLAVQELEFHGLSCVDMTGQDYGLDIVATLPLVPVAPEHIEALRDDSTGVCDGQQVTWEMSATMVAIQIKNRQDGRLSRSHLEMWNAANVRNPGSCFVIFVRPNALRVLNPDHIKGLYTDATLRGTESIDAFTSGEYIEFRIGGKSGALGRVLTAWGHHGRILSEFDSFQDALLRDGTLTINEADQVMETMILLNHLDDDDLQRTADGLASLDDEIEEMVELIQPICADSDFGTDEHSLGFLQSIISDNTWIDSNGRGRAFTRENRGLPTLLPKEIRDFLIEYARCYVTTR